MGAKGQQPVDKELRPWQRRWLDVCHLVVIAALQRACEISMKLQYIVQNKFSCELQIYENIKTEMGLPFIVCKYS